MNWLQRLGRWLVKQTEKQTLPSSAMLLRDLMARARAAQYAERYSESLQLLEEAADIARAAHETTVFADILLNKADALMRQQRPTEAAALLDELKAQATVNKHRAPLAYTLCSLGELAQMQGDWEQARQHFEEAYTIAQEAQMAGAGGRAQGHLADTYLHEGNASYAIYLLRNALEKLNASGDTELIPYFLGQLGRAEVISGHVTQGLEFIQRGLELATTTQQRRAMRQLNIILGRHMLQTGDYAEAFKHYSNAIALLPDAPPPTPETVDALTRQSYAALKIHDLRVAESAAVRAHAAATRLNDPTLLAHTQAMLGMALRATGQRDQAMTHLHAAMQAYDHLETDAFAVDVWRNLAAAQLDAGEPETALQTYDKALAMAQTARLQRPAAQTLQDMAIYRYEQGELASAMTHWLQALALYETLGDAGEVARLHCALGAARARMGEGRRALRDYEQAAERINRLGDPVLRGHVLAQVAVAFNDNGDIDSAEAFFSESIRIAERTRDLRAEVTRRGNYGYFLTLLNRPQPAITELMHAQNLAGEMPLLPHQAIWQDSLGVAHRLLGNLQQALTLHRAALEQLDATAFAWRAHVGVSLTETLMLAGQPDAAAETIAQAQAASAQVQHVPLALRVQIVAAQVALAQGDAASAASHLAMPIDRIYDTFDRRLHVRLQIARSQLAALQGDTTQAAQFWHEAERQITILRMPPVEATWLAPA